MHISSDTAASGERKEGRGEEKGEGRGRRGGEGRSEEKV